MERRERIAILLLPAHRKAIERIAEADGEPMSVVLRRLVREEARERGLWPEAQAQGQPQEARQVLRAAGIDLERQGAEG